MKTILVTGGNGLVGKVLVEKLVKLDYKVIVLSRSKKKESENISYALWNINKGEIDIEAIKKVDAIIHLAGAGVMDKKWTDEYKKEIEHSRTKSSGLIIDALKNNEHKVKTIVSASAIGWYGEDKGDGLFFKEDEKSAEGFLGNTCKLWEQSVEAAAALNIRVCKLRIGIVLSKDGGAYKEFKTPLKFGIAAILGSGKQIISWIHIEDLCNQFIFALENDSMHGSYNAVTAMPVSNKVLTLQIANVTRGNFFIPIHVPTFMLKIILGDRSIEILKSTTVSNEKIVNAGYKYLYPSIEEAVKNIEQKN